MKSLEIPRAIGAALITVAISGTPNVAAADIKDYEFQLVDQTVPRLPDLFPFHAFA